MSGRTVSVLATASEAENAAVRLVLDRFASCLAGLEAKRPEFRFLAAGGQAGALVGDHVDIVVTSLLRDAPETDEVWAETEARLRHHYAESTKGGARHYLCTVFRHIGHDQPPALRARIRKLNLLAIELSREMGVFVVDIDRCLADVGAFAYATDFRLAGDFAIEAVAREMGMTFLGTGFDAPFTQAARERLRTMVADWQPPRAVAVEHDFSLRREPRITGQAGLAGARFQTREARAAEYLRRFVQGQLPMHTVAKATAAVVKRDGVAGFTRLAWKSLRQTLPRR
jgi:hypothetical protein